MSNHRWNNNQCTKCNCKRMKKTIRTLMAIVNHPPWEAWSSEQVTFYMVAGSKVWMPKRPDCITQNKKQNI